MIEFAEHFDDLERKRFISLQRFLAQAGAPDGSYRIAQTESATGSHGPEMVYDGAPPGELTARLGFDMADGRAYATGSRRTLPDWLAMFLVEGWAQAARQVSRSDDPAEVLQRFGLDPAAIIRPDLGPSNEGMRLAPGADDWIMFYSERGRPYIIARSVSAAALALLIALDADAERKNLASRIAAFRPAD